MGNYEIVVLVGWAIAIWAICSVLSSDSTRFSALGRSKRNWFFIAVAAFIPYVGIIAALCYLFMVRVHFPPKPKRPRQPRPAGNSGNSGNAGYGGSGYGGNRAGGGSPQQMNRQPPQRQRCTCQGGTVACTSCSGGYTDSSRTQRHMACGGTGRLRCQMCGGSGYR
jgi:hypothetical protein